MSSEFDINQAFNQEEQRGAKVLIVEDDDISSRFLKELLINYDVSLVYAQDGIEAFEKYKEHEDIQLVLLDIRLPRLNGYKLAGMFKELRPEVPVIAQTAYGLSTDREKCIEAGCDDYIKKPINIELFYEKIEAYLTADKFV